MTASPTQPKLLDQVRGKIRVKHYSIRTEQANVDWIKRFIVLLTSVIRVTWGLPRLRRF